MSVTAPGGYDMQVTPKIWREASQDGKAELIKFLIVEYGSAGEASKHTGISRNALLGYAHRNGFVFKGARFNMKPVRTEADIARAARKKAYDQRRRVLKAFGLDTPDVRQVPGARVASQIVKSKKDKAAIKKAFDAHIEHLSDVVAIERGNHWKPVKGISKPKTLADLGSNECHWPLWTMGDEQPPGEKLYCGAPRADGTAQHYCNSHLRLACVSLVSYRRSLGQKAPDRRKYGNNW